ncbi:hypothetical protein IU500_06895 [Nocardia terpenica]|uniref:hypothetical protein n=1 Tax=Nocardia terpenica TaxID=455432 RepID=UPI0018940763|nr:hypothetical protein [Nocardia terpenica]MBF6060503.1 hypothetical protein [Nocardia terpenica]MBF6103763.1 hypothetical protein [Nocardia terpenica]MBF6111863.1 hypothetical protein [Nocardia terpenica]MBF6117984.1 hypothetical protein [Nocardia terpenica]MBF6155290.1 hypothetical protein [Nocardia terpenica]
MPITPNPDGSITWTGTVVFTGATEPLSTGVATLTLTPSGGLSNLPALVNGEPGMPPTFRNIIVNQIPYGTTPPASTATLVSPGGPGTASVYDLTLYVNAGQPGPAGSNATVLAAGDVVAAGIVDGWTLIYNAAQSKLVAAPPKRIIGPFASAALTPYTGNAGSATLATVGIPAQPWAWRPRVHGHLYTVGTPNTHIDAVVRVGDPASGDIVGMGLGLTGTTTAVVTVGPHFAAPVTGTSSYGQVAAGATATLSLLAAQTAATTDTWQVLAAGGQFLVDVVPS